MKQLQLSLFLKQTFKTQVSSKKISFALMMFFFFEDSPGYDRIYCGAACPQEYESFMKNLLNINGLLIMPFNDQVRPIVFTVVELLTTTTIGFPFVENISIY